MPSNGNPPENPPLTKRQNEDDAEPDAWDKRISVTGCAAENTRLYDCFVEKKDWRKCQKEMEVFKECWKAKGNTSRTGSRDN